MTMPGNIVCPKALNARELRLSRTKPLTNPLVKPINAAATRARRKNGMSSISSSSNIGRVFEGEGEIFFCQYALALAIGYNLAV